MSNDLARVLSGVRLLMLDFDGPICSIFARYTAPAIAQELRELLAALGRPATDAIRATNDPLQILRLVAEDHDGQTTTCIANALRAAETRAVDSAEPTPDVADLIASATTHDITLAVVSNNSQDAIHRYLQRAGLITSFAAVVGRYDGQPPSLLKPDPHLLELALRQTNTNPDDAVLVGDSIADILAAHTAGVRCIAYRPTEAELASLVRAGADVTSTSMRELADAIRNVASGGGFRSS